MITTTTKPRMPPAQRMRGQALTELAVAAAVLVPIFLLVPILAKYGHTRQMAQQAARNAAWEATATRSYGLESAAQIRRKVLDRNFAASDAPIRSATSSQTTGRFEDPMLNTFSNQHLLERDNVRVTQYSQTSAPGILSNIIGRIPGAAPNSAGYVTANVELKLRNLKTRNGAAMTYMAPFDSLDLVINEKHTLLADAWNAAGPTTGARSVRAQVKTFVPTSNLAAFEKVFNVIGALPIPMLGKLDDLDPGVIEPDIVPADKLARFPVNGQ